MTRLSAAVAVRCRCGQRIVLEPRWIGKPSACARCQADFVVTFVIDPRTRQKCPHVRYLPQGGPSEAVHCACGTRIRVAPEILGHTLGCTQCSRHLIVRKEEGTYLVEVVQPPAPKGGTPARAARTTEAARSKPGLPAGARRAKEGARSAKEGASAKAGRPPPPPEMRLLCVCGEELAVPAVFYDRNMYCAGCGALMHLRLGYDAKTGTYELQGAMLAPPR